MVHNSHSHFIFEQKFSMLDEPTKGSWTGQDQKHIKNANFKIKSISFAAIADRKWLNVFLKAKV